MNASTEENPVYCLDCGKTLTGKRHFVSPLQTAHCRRCVHPNALDNLVRDPRVRMLGVQALVLLVAAWMLAFLLGAGQPR
jgi:uncharacterized paraquat-inducible protein A